MRLCCALMDVIGFSDDRQVVRLWSGVRLLLDFGKHKRYGTVQRELAFTVTAVLKNAAKRKDQPGDERWPDAAAKDRARALLFFCLQLVVPGVGTRSRLSVFTLLY